MSDVQIRNITKDIDDFMASKIQVYPQHMNRASSIGHPCNRFLVYSRLNYEEQEKHDVGLQYIFNEGHLHEDAVIDLLKDAGFKVIESQRTEVWREYQLTGRIDGKIEIEGKIYLMEIKSINQFKWEKLNTEEDLRNDTQHYIRGYYDQMQVYLLLHNMSAGIFLFKNKQSGRLKQINIALDYEYAEKIVKKLEQINIHVKNKEYPDRIEDRDICASCPFRTICLPSESFNPVTITNLEALTELLRERELYKDDAKRFDEIDDKVKDILKVFDAGSYMISGEFDVVIKKQNRTFFAVPEDVKAQYKETKEVTISKIVKIK